MSKANILKAACKAVAAIGLAVFLGGQSASATITVTGLVSQITSTALDTKITFTPSQDILLLTNGLSVGPAKTISTTNGGFSLLLNPGTYLVRLPLIGGRNAFTIGVPHGNGPENITNLIAAPWTYEQFVNTIPSGGAAVTGSGLATTTTNGSVVTVNVTTGAVLSAIAPGYQTNFNASATNQAFRAVGPPSTPGLQVFDIEGLRQFYVDDEGLHAPFLTNTTGTGYLIGVETGSDGKLLRFVGTIDNDTTGNAATASTATGISGAAVTAVNNIAATNAAFADTNGATSFVGNGARLTNLTGTNLDFIKVTTQVGDAALSWPFMQLADSNTPPELLYRPNSMTGGGEHSIPSATQVKLGLPPRGFTTWNAYGTNFNGQDLTNKILTMVTNGMVRNGYNWLMIDEGYGYVASTPGSTAFDGGISKWDANRFPGGAKAIVDFAHSKGIKCMIYGGPVPYGPAGCYVWGGTNLSDFALNVSNYINYIGIDGFKWEGSAAGNVHVLVNEINKWSKPMWVNVASSTNHHEWTTYEPWMADTVNSWRPGVGKFGDINGRADRLYQWADFANFSMIRPGHVVNFDMLANHPAYWGIDVPEIKTAGTKYTGNLNILAMMAMANSEIWLAQTPTHEGTSHRYASYYGDYNNPLIHAIQTDFTKPVWKQSSNELAVAYGKWLKDGSLAVLIQNRSTTNKTEVINFDDYFGNHAPAMVQSTNANVCTVRDVLRNMTLSYYTNTYSQTISPTNIAWVKITKGIVEQYVPGTNYLSDYGWAYSTNYPDNDPGMGVNYTYLPYGSGKIFINSTTYDHGFYSAHGNFVRLKYPLHKQADYFSATVWNRFNGANSGVNIYTNDVLAQTVLMPTTGSVSNILCGVTNADWITIELTNTTAGAAFVVADPLIFCRGQTKVDEQGRQVRTLHESVINAAFSAASTPVLVGSGVGITNIGENIIYFDSLPNNGFNRISGASPSPNGTLFAGFAGSGASARRCNVFVPGWVTNAIFDGMQIESSAVSTWTNLIEPSFYARDGKFVGSGGGLNASNEVCMITAAGGVSNYTFTVKWPATNVSVKCFQMSFLTATNTTATHYIGPAMRVRYNP
jgi:hypothetical protein